MSELDTVLAERGEVYGDYAKVAECSQKLKAFMRCTGDKYTHQQNESIDMICNKFARIIIGDPNHKDSWVDIAGYAMLVANDLENKESHAQ